MILSAIFASHALAASAVPVERVLHSQKRSVAMYSQLLIDAPVDVQYSVSDTRSVEVIATDAAIPILSSVVVGQTLTITLTNAISTPDPIKLVISGPSPSSLTISNSASVVAEGLSGPEVDVTVYGSGSIEASGSVSTLKAHVAGSGFIDAMGLTAEDARIKVEGDGSAVVFATNSVFVEIEGAGHVTVSGNPTRRDMGNVSGGGWATFE